MASNRKNYLSRVVNVLGVTGGVIGRVSLGIVDSFVFEISKLLVTVFDEIEYREAKSESRKAARKPAKTSVKYSPEQSPDGYQLLDSTPK